MSPYSVPALVVPEKDETMRMCVDNCTINNITIKYMYPILSLDDILDESLDAKAFSMIDMRIGHH